MAKPKKQSKKEWENFFVHYPPSLSRIPEGLPSLPHTDGPNDPDQLKLISLVHTIKEYRHTHDPFLAAQCLVLSHELRVFLPEDVLDWLHHGMKAFLHPFKKEKDKKLHLHAYLGLKKKPGPQSHPLTSFHFEFIWNDVITWQEAFGLSQKKAFGVVAPHYQDMTAALFTEFTKHKKKYPLWHRCRKKRELFWSHWLRDTSIEHVINLDDFINKQEFKKLIEAKDAEGNLIVLDDEILQRHREYQGYQLKKGGRKKGAN